MRPSGKMTEILRGQQGDPHADFSEFFGHDIRYVYIPVPERPKGVPEREWLPRPEEEAIARCREETACLQGRGLTVCSAYACGVFEQAKHWLGHAETLTMPFEEPGRLEAELDRITRWKMDVYGAYVAAGVDIVWIGDDLGSQRGLIMSPDHYREWYRPCHTRITEQLRRVRPDVWIAFHCCGYVTALIPDLMEVGIDILEGVQPECMEIRELKRNFGRDISFWGAIGAQSFV